MLDAAGCRTMRVEAHPMATLCALAALHALLSAERKELCRNLGDGVNQAADISWLATSIPSRNVTPRTILGN